ncbi:TonB-dependent receptor domain-containing protein [Sphingomonas quercus]|uniref:TonB-dependent receptor n=1 Tax=Sphingomonas quercus TaxID=2842451 RepID=A0ABS6BL47_9SPHN|nr:TonB-dependent receptor [Sphingomonas quercus]MBU3079037.1 TonB-dependent receptor [Sphingomonas quercus]
MDFIQKGLSAAGPRQDRLAMFRTLVPSPRNLLLAGVGTLVMATGAFAQSAPAENAKSDEIVITGSRVITNGNNSPTPVTVISTETLNLTTPTNVPDGLRKLPSFAGSRNASTLGNSSSNSVGNFLNLRSFGVIRTLILLDGRRVPSTNADGTVDTNTLPQMLLQRVDVVTGGASAVYGSDAVTGVVNFVLDKKFDGVKANVQSGISQRGDAFSYRAGLAAGTDLFGGRGHIEASYERFRQNGIGNKFERQNGRDLYAVEGSGTQANPFHLVSNAHVASSSFGGAIMSGTLKDTNFYADGLYRPYNHGLPSGSAGIEIGGDGTYVYNSSIMATLQTDQVFGRFDYDLTDDVHFYAQGSWARTYNLTNSGALNMLNYTISANNPYLPQELAARLAAANEPTFLFSHTYNQVPVYQTEADAKVLNVTAGLNGKLGDLDWDIFYTHGESSQHVRALHNLNNGRAMAALDSVRDPASGNIVCRVTLTNPGGYPGCAPLNPFGPTAMSQAAQDYIFGTTVGHLTNKVEDVGGTVSGSPFSTWAGPVRVAVTGEWRHLTLTNTSNADPRIHPDCTGIAYSCSASSLMWLAATTAPVRASQNVGEGAIEVNVPILRDVPFARSLDLNGAFRYTDYSVSGGAKTWKIGGDWYINDAISFRATRSRDIRAPTLFELFAPQSLSITGFTDLHTNISRQVATSSQGNSDLKPEVADTFTAGVVLKPSFLPRFSLSVDYYQIKIGNAITSVGGTNALAQCEQSNGASPLCALFERPLPFSDHSEANFPTLIRTQSLNVANTRTKGVDFEANYTTPLSFGDSPLLTGGRLNIRGLVTYQPVLETVQFEGAPTITSAGVASGAAKIRATLLVDYSTDKWSLSVQERWRSHLAWNGTPGLVYTIPDVPSVAFTDLTLTAKVGPQDRFDIFLSVQNLFDKTAPVWTSQTSSPNYSYPVVNGDDYIGRYFTAGVRVRF